MLASEGYPQKYETGFEIALPACHANEDIYIAGARKQGEKLVTSGGRVLGAVATAEDLPRAVEAAYALAGRISFQNAYMRHDIGRRALAAFKN